MSEKEQYENLGRLVSEEDELGRTIGHLTSRLYDYIRCMEAAAKYVQLTVQGDDLQIRRPPEEPDWSTLPDAAELQALIHELHEKRQHLKTVKEQLRAIRNPAA